MAVNCAAIPSELLESELFGHERGAFSGAHQRHLGYAERARGGILFLDEIAAMPLALQAKMLRVLEERSFHRVGGESPIPLKARIVCATSESLEEQARSRRDSARTLLYRINAVTVELPPLRERSEDIPWLLSRYFSLFAEQAETELRGISSMAEEVALSHPWRGNVRELRNRVERAVNLSNGPWIMPADLFPELRNCSVRRRRSNAAPRSGARRGREAANRASSPGNSRPHWGGGEAAGDFANDAVGEDAALWDRAGSHYRVTMSRRVVNERGVSIWRPLDFPVKFPEPISL